MTTQTPERVDYLFEAQAAFDAVYNGKHTEGTFYLRDWDDKPHRVVSRLVNLLREAAQRPVEASPLPGDGYNRERDEEAAKNAFYLVPMMREKDAEGDFAYSQGRCRELLKIFADYQCEQATAPLREALEFYAAAWDASGFKDSRFEPYKVTPQQKLLDDKGDIARGALAAHPTKAESGKPMQTFAASIPKNPYTLETDGTYINVVDADGHTTTYGAVENMLIATKAEGA